MNRPEKIKKIFYDNFRRVLSDKEAEDILLSLESQTRTALSQVPGFSETNFQRYFNENLAIVFSPKTIHTEVLRIVDEIGIEALEASSKYKRLSEMVDASTFCLALKKIQSREWMILGQDNPDILLISPSGKPFNKKPMDALSLEIMQITEQAKNSFSQDVEQSTAEFIRDKKFQKRYGNVPHLLIHINFNHEGLDLEKISKILCGFPGNPFHQIWVRMTITPYSRINRLATLTPGYKHTDIDFLNERDLLF